MRNGDDPTYVNVAVNEDLKKLAKDQHTNEIQSQPMKKEKPYEPQIKETSCRKCGEHFLSHISLNTHLEDKHGAKISKCEQCPYTTDRTGSLNRHYKIVHEKIKDYRCIQCNYETGDRGNLGKHIESVHPPPPVPLIDGADPMMNLPPPSNLGSKNMVSAPDGENEGQWTEEKIALAGEHVITEYRCVKCTYKSDRRNAIRKHIEAVHKKIRRFTCDKCGHEFNQLGNLYTHIKKKHKN